MKIPIYLLALFIFLASHVHAKNRVNEKFWERVEIGTNVIPMVDSITLKPSNLMVKYFYDRNMNRAFRVNLFSDNVEIDPGIRLNYINNYATYSLEIGHLWYYTLNDKVKLYQAADLEYDNFTNSLYITDEPDHIWHWNKFYLNYSLGVRYNVYKKISLELETRFRMGVYKSYTNYYYTQEGICIYTPQNNSRLYLNYYPVHSININYKF